jgi:protein-L-isoaspartate(D-aspartate) O-methyltransferase
VLEVGTGSGYQTALLAMLASVVFSVERITLLAQLAWDTLATAGIKNVSVVVGDGTLGWRPYAPFDAILVAAASPEVPRPLIDQLAPDGRLIIPLGDRTSQVLTLVTKTGDTVHLERLTDVRFVPLLGQHGFSEPTAKEPGWSF